MICLRVAFSSCIWHYSLSCCLRDAKKVHLHLLLVLKPHLSILLINSILLTLLSLRAQTQSAIAQQRSSSETADDLHDDCWFDKLMRHMLQILILLMMMKRLQISHLLRGDGGKEMRLWCPNLQTPKSSSFKLSMMTRWLAIMTSPRS